MDDSELKRRVKAEYVRLRQNHWQKKAEETKTDESSEESQNSDKIDKETVVIDAGSGNEEEKLQVSLSFVAKTMGDEYMCSDEVATPDDSNVVLVRQDVEEDEAKQETDDDPENNTEMQDKGLKRQKGDHEDNREKFKHLSNVNRPSKKLRPEESSLEHRKSEIERLRERRRQIEESLERERIEIEIKETQRLEQLQLLEQERLELEKREKQRMEQQELLEHQRNEIEVNLKQRREKREQLERQKIENSKREEQRLLQLEKLEQEIISIEAREEQDEEDQESVENELFQEFAVPNQSPEGSENTSDVAKSVLDALSPFMNQVTGLLSLLHKKMQACEVRLSAVEAGLRFQRSVLKPKSSVTYPSSSPLPKIPVISPIHNMPSVSQVFSIPSSAPSFSPALLQITPPPPAPNENISHLLVGLSSTHSAKIKALITKCKDRNQLTRYLLDLFFTMEELANSNHDGVMGKLKLDDTRIDLISKIAFTAFPVQEIEGEMEHTAVKKFKAEVNAKCRSRRYDFKQTSFNATSEEMEFRIQSADT